MNTQETLQQRESVHGDFTKNADMQDKLISQMTLGSRWTYLEPHQRIALIYIAGKISRILAGDNNYADHWHDIGGYSKCVEDRLQPEKLVGVLGQVRPTQPCPQCGQKIPLTVPSGKCPLCSSQLV